MFQPNMVPVDNNGDVDNNDNINNNIDGGLNVGGEGFDNVETIENQEGGLGQAEDPPLNKRKRYHRHSQHQIHEMESFFRECPHPDDKQRKQLGRQLGLDHLQIKFWFQNKRTQNKNQLERQENFQLRNENEILRAENHRLRDAMVNATCPQCGGGTAISDLSFEEHHLRIDNTRLSEEIHHLTVLAVKCTGKPVASYALVSPPVPPPPFEVGMETVGEVNLSRSITGPADVDNNSMIILLALGAMEEFMMMAQLGEPLWMGGINGTSLSLNLNEYTRTFQNGLGPRLNGYRTEASRDTALVGMSHSSIVQLLMNANLSSSMFGGMIARAVTHEVIFAGVPGNHDGALQIMSSELQVISPLVSTRESYFVRYCKQQGENVWAVVDISIDHLFPNIQLHCRRRPSGCLIQEIQSNYSKVTWIEHVEVNESAEFCHIFKDLIRSGEAYGANRWLSTLDRQCERISSIVNSEYPSMEPNGLTTLGKKGVLKLAERMVRSFFAGVNSSLGTTLSGDARDDIKAMTVTSLDDPGRPNGVALCAATSFWVPIPPKAIFDFIRDANNRSKWDVLATNGLVNKMTEIPNGRDSRNCVALFRNTNSQSRMMMIQETSTDPTASFVIYAPVDMSAVETVLSGGESDTVALLPSGVAILPDGMTPGGDRGGGSLITVAFQMLVDAAPSAQLTVSSVATVENLVLVTAQKMKTLFQYPTA